MAVGSGGGSGARGDGATGTRLIDQHGLLAPNLAEPVGHYPHGRIGAAARRQLRYEFYRTCRVSLSQR
jgi:hypothetical protein